MSEYTSFVVGLFIGVYIAQTYKIPKVTTMVRTLITKISEYEKKGSRK
jgi:hypothetical protein